MGFLEMLGAMGRPAGDGGLVRSVTDLLRTGSAVGGMPQFVDYLTPDGKVPDAEALERGLATMRAG